MIKITLLKYKDVHGWHRAKLYDENLIARDIKDYFKKYHVEGKVVVI